MKYNRILIKLSGEALQGDRDRGINPAVVKFIADEIKEAQALGAKIAVVVGGGNIWRGSVGADQDGIKEESGHYMGMLAITINCFALSDMLNSLGVRNQALSALGQIGKMEAYTPEKGDEILDQGEVLLLSGGTGKPFCSSDSGAAIRATELDLDVIFKMTKVDGVYDADPVTNPTAKKFTSLSFDEVLQRDLKVMDRGAIETCRESGIPIVVFKMEKGNIKKAIDGENVGTIIN